MTIIFEDDTLLRCIPFIWPFMMQELKMKVATAAIDYLTDYTLIGVGSGSTVNCFIQALATIKHRLEGCVASSINTATRLREVGIPVLDLNVVGELPIYIDSADEVNSQRVMIKGGGGAHAREKIVANVANQFICIVDDSKLVSQLGVYPIAVEVLPIARSFVARELVKLGGDPVYRDGFTTDNGNIIIDVYHLALDSPAQLEEQINLIPGVVENGLFAHRQADTVLIAGNDKIWTI